MVGVGRGNVILKAVVRKGYVESHLAMCINMHIFFIALLESSKLKLF